MHGARSFHVMLCADQIHQGETPNIFSFGGRRGRLLVLLLLLALLLLVVETHPSESMAQVFINLMDVFDQFQDVVYGLHHYRTVAIPV